MDDKRKKPVRNMQKTFFPKYKITDKDGFFDNKGCFGKGCKCSS